MPLFKKNRQKVANARGKLLRDALLDNNSTSTKATTTTTTKVQLTTRNYSILSFSGYHFWLPVTIDITPTTSTTTHVHYNLIPMAETHASTMQTHWCQEQESTKKHEKFSNFLVASSSWSQWIALWTREFAAFEIVLRCTVVVSPSNKKWLIRRTNIETREKRNIIYICID
jgi:hypothetical protein